MKNKIDVDKVIDTITMFSDYLKSIRKCADKAKAFSCDAKVVDLETFSRSIKDIENVININKKVIGLLPLCYFDADDCDLNSNNKILKIMKEVK